MSTLAKRRRRPRPPPPSPSRASARGGGREAAGDAGADLNIQPPRRRRSPPAPRAIRAARCGSAPAHPRRRRRRCKSRVCARDAGSVALYQTALGSLVDDLLFALGAPVAGRDAGAASAPRWSRASRRRSPRRAARPPSSSSSASRSSDASQRVLRRRADPRPADATLLGSDSASASLLGAAEDDEAPRDRANGTAPGAALVGAQVRRARPMPRARARSASSRRSVSAWLVARE